MRTLSELYWIGRHVTVNAVGLLNVAVASRLSSVRWSGPVGRKSEPLWLQLLPEFVSCTAERRPVGGALALVAAGASSTEVRTTEME